MKKQKGIEPINITNVRVGRATRTSYSHKIADARKERKRDEGEVRDAAWRRLGIEAQLKSLSARRGESRKQTKRLTGLDLSANNAYAKLKREGQF
jgi:hypothetical protein